MKEGPDSDADRTQTDVYLTYRDDPLGSHSAATVQLTRTGDNEEPRWSPDGEQIAFLSEREQAEAYVEWLSEQTGRDYRLPTAAELEALKKARRESSENTPAYWAGFSPNLDEYRRLRARLEAQPTDALLMPVGSRPPGHGEDGSGPLVYDVDGNVAEWARADDGLEARTASALTWKDPKAETDPDVPARVTGLRVVLEREQ